MNIAEICITVLIGVACASSIIVVAAYMIASIHMKYTLEKSLKRYSRRKENK